ncbi:hypothetical protein [Aliikangiella sp. IMCC44632]
MTYLKYKSIIKTKYSVMTLLLICLSSCYASPIVSKKLYKKSPSSFDIEIAIQGVEAGWNYLYIDRSGKKSVINESQIFLPAFKKIKFSGVSNDVIRTCLVRESDQRIDQIPKNLRIESNLTLDLIPGFKNEKLITFSEPKTYTMSCFVDGSIKQLDVIKLTIN